MDTKYKSHSFVKLWIATTIFILCCFTTDMSAQNTAAADTVAAVTETITEVVAAPAEEASAAPDTVGELALGLNTVWMLLAAMLTLSYGYQCRMLSNRAGNKWVFIKTCKKTKLALQLLIKALLHNYQQ